MSTYATHLLEEVICNAVEACGFAIVFGHFLEDVIDHVTFHVASSALALPKAIVDNNFFGLQHFCIGIPD